jgi:hypothetical protein
MVTGMFRDGASVERAYGAVTRLGYDKDDINVVMSDETRKRYFSEHRPVDTDLARKTAEGGELGGPKGGRIGILLPILAAVGTTVALSGVGLIAAGPIAAALAGAGATGLAAGLIGAMADWGIPEERLRQYEADIHDGGILVGVKSRSQEDSLRIAELWTSLGGQRVHS